MLNYESRLEIESSDGGRRVSLPGGFRITAAPASEPLTLEFVKNYLKVDGTADDALITHLIKGARTSAEMILNMGLLEQTVEESFEGFPQYWHRNPLKAITLKRGPLIAISSISYYDTDNAQQTLAASKYTARRSDATLPVVTPAPDEAWPETAGRPDAVTVTYQVGFADADSIPVDILDAILLMVADSYDNRTDSVKRLPTGSRLKLQAHQLNSFWT